MPTLLQINSVVNSGSTGKIVEQISDKAIENSWLSFIAYGRAANSSSAELIKIGNRKDLYGHVFKSFIFGKHGLASKDATRALIKKIEKIKPDIIHLHNIHGYYINYEILFGFLKNFKTQVVWTLHDCWSFTGHCSHFSDINCQKWVMGCEICPKVKNYPKSLIFDTSKRAYVLKKSLYSNFDNLQIVTVSEWLNRVVGNSFLQGHPIITIKNAVDVSIFRPKQINSDLTSKFHLANKFVMMAAATAWGKNKGLEDYLQLSSLLGEDEIIVLIGLKEEIIKRLPTNIIGISRTEDQMELVAWYNVSDVVLNLSYLETFGLTSVEGFACGKPTIVYNATASPELISDDRLGFIVKPGNISDVYKAIQIIRRNGSGFYLQACRRNVVENYNAVIQFQKYINLYMKLLSK